MSLLGIIKQYISNEEYMQSRKETIYQHDYHIMKFGPSEPRQRHSEKLKQDIEETQQSQKRLELQFERELVRVLKKYT